MHDFLEVGEISFNERVGVVSEPAFVAEVETDHFNRQVAEDGRGHFAGHAVGCVDDDLERPEFGIEELQDVLAVFVGEVAFFDPAVDAAAGVQQRRGNVLDFLEAGVFADGLGVNAGDLEAVVLGGIVRGGDLDAAAGAQIVDGE